VDVRNPTDAPQTITVTFAVANFGIGLPFTAINQPYPVTVPALAVVKQCTHWVPTISGRIDLQVMLEEQGYQPQYSQRNIDVGEKLQPGISNSPTFLVYNPPFKERSISPWDSSRTCPAGVSSCPRIGI
jgi:hypothetical protein